MRNAQYRMHANPQNPNTVMLIYRQGKPYKKNERGVKTIDLAATIYDDLIFNLVYLFVGVTAYMIYIGQLE